MAAYTLWGLLTLYWKQLAGLDAFELIGWRVSTAGLVMALVVTVLGRWPAVIGALRRRSTLGRVTLASLLLTVNWTTYVWAVVNDRVIETALGYFLAQPSEFSENYSHGIGVYVALIGGVVATVGALRWMSIAPYGPHRPLKDHRVADIKTAWRKIVKDA